MYVIFKVQFDLALAVWFSIFESHIALLVFKRSYLEGLWCHHQKQDHTCKETIDTCIIISH